MPSLHPDISYTHVLSELSVNRKDPCEVVRELVSNSYDANASLIEIYPLLQYEGFIFFDDGSGLGELDEDKANDITPYKAFFSIGKSTKIAGNAIGYKCQGSKLCFASRKFTLITKCKNESSWRFITIDNPKANLSQQYDISSQSHEFPWEYLRDLLRMPDERTSAILDLIDENYFLSKFNKGAMIIVQGLEAEDFSDFYGTDDFELSYLKNYILFNTKPSPR